MVDLAAVRSKITFIMPESFAMVVCADFCFLVQFSPVMLKDSVKHYEKQTHKSLINKNKNLI